MAITAAGHARLVLAAQHGDQQAREQLIAAYLPLVYNIVQRTIGQHPDVDDVVQETLLRAVRDLPTVRDPHSFRAWIVAITIRQIGANRDRRRAAADQTAPIDDAAELPDAAFEDLAILRLHVSDQRHEVAEASRWLDPDFRALFSLWWQENAGWLSRSDVAAATGLTVAHTGVTLQRMREQLELSRTIVAALTSLPRCAQLESTVSRWDGRRTPMWRKRIARHVRDCPACLATMSGRIPIERLLLSLAPLTVPAGLAAALAAKGLLPGAAVSGPAVAVAQSAAGAATTAASGAHTSLLGKLTHALAAHPLASLATGAVVAFSSAVVYVAWPEPPMDVPAAIAAPPAAAQRPSPATAPSVSPAPTPTPSTARPSSVSPAPVNTTTPAATVPLGAWSLESVALPGQYLTNSGMYAALGQVTATSGEQAKRQATFTVITGLADTDCVTFRASDGRYLRHLDLRMRLSPEDSTQLFREDATFCPRPGAVAGSVSLQAHNYPYLVIRYRGGGVYIEVPDGTQAFARESSFITRTPWAK